MSKKILIIDDNEQDRKIIARFLNKSGYEDIFMAQNSEEGMEKVKSVKPDLVILDTILPSSDGFEICRRIRGSEGATAPKIIIMTGSVDAVDAVKARQVGANDYCVKTSNCLSLMESVKNLI